MGHRAGLFRYPGPSPGCRRGHAAPRRRGAVRRRQRAGFRRGPGTAIPTRRSRATAARPGCWRCSSTGFARSATGATAISAISPSFSTSSPTRGCGGVGVNPLHAQFYDRPDCSGSPYSPNSRLFFNPLYIDVEALDEFDREHAASVADDIARLREARTDRLSRRCPRQARRVAPGLREFLRQRQQSRREDFAAYRAERGSALERFAAFEVLRQQHPGPWWEWPEQWRKPTDDVSGQIARERTSTSSASTNSCNGTPSASSHVAAMSLARAACPSGSTSTPRSASMPPAPMPGWTRASCCAGFRSARRPTSSIRPARIGA